VKAAARIQQANSTIRMAFSFKDKKDFAYSANPS
jgi:hypothetical protein